MLPDHRAIICGGGLVAFLAFGCGRFGFDPVAAVTCESDELCVMATSIADDAGSTNATLLPVTVTVSGVPPFEVRLVEATNGAGCQTLFADDGWQPHESATASHEVAVDPVDGEKRICAWARDSGGNFTVIAPGAGQRGVDMDVINLAASNPPVVEQFEVVSTIDGSRNHVVGGPMTISWVITDVEALALTPVDLEYTTDPPGESPSWQVLARNVGALEDDPRRAQGSLQLLAPTAAPFVVRLRARDAAGNIGVGVLSDVQNVPNWSVYMGSLDRGIGGSAHAVQLFHGDNIAGAFTVDPVTHEMFAVDFGQGVVRLDPRTGLVESFLPGGVANLPDDGPLTSASALPYGIVKLGPDGGLYVSNSDDTLPLPMPAIYRIDRATHHVRKIVGGGTEPAPTATAATAHVLPWIWTFDDAGHLYFMASCVPGDQSRPYLMMRTLLDAGGAPGPLEVVAGTCTGGVPAGDGPQDPLTVRFEIGVAIGSLAVWDGGRALYYAQYQAPTYKILDGVMYRSSIGDSRAGSIAYDPSNGHLYVANADIVEYAPGLVSGGGDEVIRTVIRADGTGHCADDGVLAEAACARVQFEMVPTPTRLYFRDGVGLNEERTYRIRYVDDAGRLRTALGAKPFHGEGLARRLVRGDIAGIHAKAATAPNQVGFPAGVYFVDPRGLVFGHVGPDQRVMIDWGSQTGKADLPIMGSVIGSDVALGDGYAGASLRALSFDDLGLPWLRFGAGLERAHLVSVDGNRRVVVHQTGSQDWELASNGDNPADFQLWPYGATSGIALEGQAAYFLGGWATRYGGPKLLRFDFGTGLVTHVMGTGSSGSTADRLTPGTVATASIARACMDLNRRCFVHYRAVDDRLYFSEASRLRYITHPSDPTQSTLVTELTRGSGDVGSFSFRPGSTEVYYTASGSLRCHNLAGPSASCNDTDIGVPAVLGAIRAAPDQFTWLNANTLLLSTSFGQVLQYTVAN